MSCERAVGYLGDSLEVRASNADGGPGQSHEYTVTSSPYAMAWKPEQNDQWLVVSVNSKVRCTFARDWHLD